MTTKKEEGNKIITTTKVEIVETVTKTTTKVITTTTEVEAVDAEKLIVTYVTEYGVMSLADFNAWDKH